MNNKNIPIPKIQLLAPEGWREYQLLDSG